MSFQPIIDLLMQMDNTQPAWAAAMEQRLRNQVESNMSQFIATSADLTARIQSLTASVEQERTVEASAQALLTGLAQAVNDVKAQLAAQGVTQEQLAALDQLNQAVTQNTGGLAAAVTANTPSAPAPTPAPAPAPTPAPAPAADASGGTSAPAPAPVSVSDTGGSGAAPTQGPAVPL